MDIPLTDGQQWDDKTGLAARWQDRQSERDGYRCIWARRLEAKTQWKPMKWSQNNNANRM